MVLYLCAMSEVKLKVTLGRESTVLWNCASDSTRNCTKIVEHLPIQIECNTYAAVWISWRVSGKLQFGEGAEVGKRLCFDASVGNANCSDVTEWDWGTETGEDTIQMTLHRSEGENRCYLTGPERVARGACGDSYTDEAWCLSCGCCFDRWTADQPSCFYPQVNHHRKKNCERTFEQILGAVEFRSMQNPNTNITTDEPVSFLILQKHTIKTADVQLNFGDGTRPLVGIELDRSTPIPDCSSGCQYVEWLRAIVTHFYTDEGVFEAVLQITDSSRGVVPFVLRKTVVTVSRSFETVSLVSLVGETDETKLQLPSFNPLLQKEFICNRVETYILYEYCSENNSATMERRNETLAFERLNDSLAFKGPNETSVFEGGNETLAFERLNDSLAFTGPNETSVFEGRNETLAFKELGDSLTIEGCSGSLEFARWNGSLAFESGGNITFEAFIETDCVPSVHNYAMSWSLHRLDSDGNSHNDDLSHKLTSSANRFNIPSHSLSRGTYKVQLEVRILDAFGIPVNISNAIAWFNILSSHEDAIDKYYFLNGTVNLTNNLSGLGFSYQWLCTTNELLNVSVIEASIDDDHPFGDCMKNTVAANTLVPSARNQLFPAAFLRFSSLPASYYFHSITRSSDSSISQAPGILSTDIRVVVLLPGDPPVVRIKCITGCSRPHAKSHPIWLEGACVNCRGTAEELRYGWTFFYAQKNNAHLRSFNWAKDSSTGSNRSYVVVFPDKFAKSLGQDEFSFTLTVSRTDLTSSTASFHFQKQTSNYGTGQNLSVEARRRNGTSSSSCRHMRNAFLVAFVTLLCFSCKLERPLYNTCLILFRA